MAGKNCWSEQRSGIYRHWHKSGPLSLPSNPCFPSENRPTRPPRSIKFPKTKPARGLEKFDPFHLRHCETPTFAAQDLFDDDEEQARAPTKWIDILERRAEAILPPRHETLIAEIAGEFEEERGRRFTKWRVFNDVNKNLTTSGMLRHGSPHNLRNLATWHLKRIVLISRHETWQTVLAR